MRGLSATMLFVRWSTIATVQLALTLALAGVMMPARAQDPLLKGLTGVRVVVTWTGGADSDRVALQTDVELKLRQVGMSVLSIDQQALTLGSMLVIGIGGGGSAVPVIVELREKVYRDRESSEFSAWMETRMRQPDPPMNAELRQHVTPIREAATWLRYGVAQSVQPESVKDIIARYATHPYWRTPAGRPLIQHQMDLEVQAAMAEAQRPTNPGTVRDTIKGYLDQFLNEWLTANPKQH